MLARAIGFRQWRTRSNVATLHSLGKTHFRLSPLRCPIPIVSLRSYPQLSGYGSSSILAPLLVVDVIVGAVALFASLGKLVGLPEPLLWSIWGLFGFCVLFTLSSYVYWSWAQPNRLQTENYQIEHQRLLLIGDERDPNSMKLIGSAPSANTKVGSI